MNEGFAHTVATGMAVNAGWMNSGLVRQRIVNPTIRTELFLASPHPRGRTPLQEQAIALAKSVFEARTRAIGA